MFWLNEIFKEINTFIQQSWQIWQKKCIYDFTKDFYFKYFFIIIFIK